MYLDTGLYLGDAYTRSFEARVIGSQGSRIALDRTAFCPGESGQQPDRGLLRWQSTTVNVDRVSTEAGTYWHHVTGYVPPVGATIVGELDWTHRLKMMRTHTAFHLLNAITFYLCGAHGTQTRVTDKGLRLCYRSPYWSTELATEIEQRVNQAIAAAIPVLTYTISCDEARQTPILNQTKIALLARRMSQIRVVEIEGVTLDIDTGTHVRNTREIGGVRFARVEQTEPHCYTLDVRLLSRQPSLGTI